MNTVFAALLPPVKLMLLELVSAAMTSPLPPMVAPPERVNVPPAYIFTVPLTPGLNGVPPEMLMF